MHILLLILNQMLPFSSQEIRGRASQRDANLIHSKLQLHDPFILRRARAFLPAQNHKSEVRALIKFHHGVDESVERVKFYVARERRR
jgi:hypothetical protein